MLHKSRDLMVRQRTMLISALRGHLAEYGIVTGLGAGGRVASPKALHEEQDRFPARAFGPSWYCRSAEGTIEGDR